MLRRFAPFLASLVTLALIAGAAAAEPQAAPVAREPGTLLVFAAASLTDVLEEVDAAFTVASGIKVHTSFASSALLAKQIEAGAPADVFISADREWMDYLEQHQLLKDGSRRDLLGNQLVLIAPVASTVRLKIARKFALAAALGGARLATGDPDSVPAGIYAKTALSNLNVWDTVSEHLLRAENVRVALAYVARGEAPLGIVYRTDALAEKRVRIVDTFPSDTHPPINYPLARTLQAQPESRRYSDYLGSQTARQKFARRGFVPLGDPIPQPK
jgi:molybdate transport system substrate-binding protein